MAKFDPKKADLNKDGVLSDYEENVGKTRAAAMRMEKSPMYNYKKGYAMQMGSREIDSPSAFNIKDAANIAASPMMNGKDPGDAVDLSKMSRSVAKEQIKHYYPGSDPYYVYTTNRNKMGESHFGSYKGEYLPGTHDFSSSAELRDMSKMTGANIAARQGTVGAKRLARVIRGARGMSGLTFSESNPKYVKSFQEDKIKPKGINYGHMDAQMREAFKNARGAGSDVKKSAQHAKNLEYFMKLEFEGLPSMGTKGPTFNKLKGNVLTSLPAGVPKVTFDGGKTKKRKGKTGVGKFLSNIGDAVSDINISLPKKKQRPGFSASPIPALNTRKRQRKLSRRR
jgi:hypothetical protein